MIFQGEDQGLWSSRVKIIWGGGMYWSDECQIAQLVKQLTKNTVGLGSNPGMVRHHSSHPITFYAIPGTDRWTPVRGRALGDIWGRRSFKGEGMWRNVKVRSVQIPSLDSSDWIPVWFVIISPISLHNISSCSFTSCSLSFLSCKLKFGTEIQNI